MTNLKNQHGELFVKPDQVGLAPVDVIIVGESPAHTEVEKGKPFVGYSGTILRNYLDRLRFRQRGITFYITNAVKVAKFDKDGTNVNPTNDEIDKWRHLIHREIVVFEPLAVLMLGHSAYYSVMGESAAAIRQLDSISKFFWYESMSCNPDLFFTYHPASLRRDDLYMLHFADTLKEMLEVLNVRMRERNESS
jgi:uracil-DNA glycosylase family 4